jgi:hypothetical protein
MGSVPLQPRARWAVVVGRRMLVVTQDDRARLLPDDHPVELPRDLVASRQAPQVTTQGLVLGGRLWRWVAR